MTERLVAIGYHLEDTLEVAFSESHDPAEWDDPDVVRIPYLDALMMDVRHWLECGFPVFAAEIASCPPGGLVIRRGEKTEPAFHWADDVDQFEREAVELGIKGEVWRHRARAKELAEQAARLMALTSPRGMVKYDIGEARTAAASRSQTTRSPWGKKMWLKIHDDHVWNLRFLAKLTDAYIPPKIEAMVAAIHAKPPHPDAEYAYRWEDE